MIPPLATETPTSARRDELLARAPAIEWYHAMEIAPGVEVPGEVDLRPYVDAYGIPDDLSGMRAIDIATFNGFWAFELERRGADVVALDLADASEMDRPAFSEWRPANTAPIHDGFYVARELKGSNVERVECSVYDVSSEDIGSFDLVFCGSMLIHLRDQFRALERMCGLMDQGGLFISAEVYDPVSSLLPFPTARYRAHKVGAPVFWEPAARTWGLMIEASGFRRVRRRARFKMKSSRGYTVRHVVHHATR